MPRLTSSIAGRRYGAMHWQTFTSPRSSCEAFRSASHESRDCHVLQGECMTGVCHGRAHRVLGLSVGAPAEAGSRLLQAAKGHRDAVCVCRCNRSCLLLRGQPLLRHHCYDRHCPALLLGLGLPDGIRARDTSALALQDNMSSHWQDVFLWQQHKSFAELGLHSSQRSLPPSLALRRILLAPNASQGRSLQCISMCYCLCAKSSLTSISSRLAPSEAACWASCPEATRLPTRFTDAGRDRLATNVGRPEQQKRLQ